MAAKAPPTLLRKTAGMASTLIDNWKTLASNIAAVALTLFAAYLAVGREVPTEAQVIKLIQLNAVSRDEVQTLINTTGPYNADRALIMKTMATQEASQKELTQAIRNNTEALVELRTILARSQSD